MSAIFTINARSHVMLEFLRKYYKLTDLEMRQEILALHSETQKILATKGIDYSKLKTALTPSSGKYEVALIFDSKKSKSSWYGLEIAQALIPKFDPRSSHSILCGDLISGNQEFIYDLLQKSLFVDKPFDFIHSSLLYCVYINNLSETMFKQIHEGLSNFEPYVGFIDTTYSSIAKTYLSTVLVPTFLKHNSKIIMGHEDDRPNEENINMLGFPFEENGYQCLSMQASYFDVFLTYKIERAVYSGFESDTEFSINAISNTLISLKNLQIIIEKEKLKYLHTEKAGKMKKAGLINIDILELTELIKSKIETNYIYNLEYLEEHNVSKFNLMLEITKSSNEPPIKILVSLEYKPQDEALRLITLY